MVKFISYDGEWPNLCRGNLILEIDSKVYTFGNDEKQDFESFWESGGYCNVDWDGNCTVCSGDWVVNEDELPEQFRKYAREICDIMNSNVPCGCCGGCI